MTVENVGEKAVTGDQAVWCVWFDDKKQMRDTFALEALESYVSGKPKRVSRVCSSGWQG